MKQHSGSHGWHVTGGWEAGSFPSPELQSSQYGHWSSHLVGAAVVWSLRQGNETITLVLQVYLWLKIGMVRNL